jgi:hypothetical protein
MGAKTAGGGCRDSVGSGGFAGLAGNSVGTRIIEIRDGSRGRAAAMEPRAA